MEPLCPSRPDVTFAGLKSVLKRMVHRKTHPFPDMMVSRVSSFQALSGTGPLFSYATAGQNGQANGQ